LDRLSVCECCARRGWRRAATVGLTAWRAGPTDEPEGALLLPLGASTLRTLRRNRTV
jgi:hypothetical protein